jgi:hypothetical protein
MQPQVLVRMRCAKTRLRYHFCLAFFAQVYDALADDNFEPQLGPARPDRGRSPTIMSKPPPLDPCEGMPPDLPPALRKALAAELRRAGVTYAEAVRAADGPTSPETILAVTRHWNNLTPEQVATWEEAARRKNPEDTDSARRN